MTTHSKQPAREEGKKDSNSKQFGISTAVDGHAVLENSPSKLDATEIAAASAEINQLHGSLLDLGGKAIEAVVCIGQKLLSVKQSLLHRRWLPYLEGNFPFTDQTARNYIGLYNRRNDPEVRRAKNLRAAYQLIFPTPPETKKKSSSKREQVSVGERLKKLFGKATPEEQRAFYNCVKPKM